MPFRDDDRQGLDPREFPEPDEIDDGCMPCPYCRAQIHEESERCPSCGRYFSEEDTASDKPWWFLIGVLVCLAISVFWVLTGW